MAAVVADTHAAIWYMLKLPHLSSNALAALDGATTNGDPIYLASISLVEIIYLVEKGRLPQVAQDRLNDALIDPNSALVLAPLSLTVAQAVQRISRNVVPDMPDRIIAATAVDLNLPLVTRDQKIRLAGIKTIW